ncbi:hypothetical protein KC19_1G282100 [Ceratodon purpureus]|uniref:Uncharacterized protein n=1 Tax=Ceratodon purpureus TaxID=3225 RepID=A0A8T0JCR0_CERPU|nr:hypothetical protein KC19_1G282100 [Ceratodon purpureus]
MSCGTWVSPMMMTKLFYKWWPLHPRCLTHRQITSSDGDSGGRLCYPHVSSDEDVFTWQIGLRAETRAS